MKLASIEVIKNIRNHPNADSLDIAEVLGWQVVVKRGTHQEGDKIVFVTIDSIVPHYTWTNFLADPKNPDKPIRIKNIKLRGEYSSGLVISLNEFSASPFKDYEIGTDLTEIIGVTKYIKEVPANLSGETAGDFPTHIASKTDEDNGLNDPELVNKVLYHEPFLTVTQKLDGSSITLIVENGVLSGVCTRNFSKKENENNAFWKAARKLIIPENWTGIIQGELCGNGIQRNQLKLEDIKIFVFQIKTNDKYMTYDEMKDFCLNQLKCDVVPLICHLDVSATVKLWANPLQKLQEVADKQKYLSGLDAEGIVVRPQSYPKSFGSRRPFGFKLINRNYKD
jgi:RNA ligase (TIGR02306 family)